MINFSNFLASRSLGVLCPIFSLPSNSGIGDFSGGYKFVDFLQKSGQSIWQVLPLNIPDGAGSTYNSVSSFAGNWLFVSAQKGKKSKKDVGGIGERVNYKTIWPEKEKELRDFYKSWEWKGNMDDFDQFVGEEKNWLWDFAIFQIIKKKFNGKPWYKWSKALKERNILALEKVAVEEKEEFNFIYFCQWQFFKQWQNLKVYANARGIKIIGDLPFFSTFDSADVWANRDNFLLDEKNKPLFRAGVPPDYFSKNGQFWGNPQYDWEKMKKTGFSWWIKRLKHSLKLFDGVRLDHFRGFMSLWYVKGGKKTAKNGKWVSVPGEKLFSRWKTMDGEMPFIAEDLGKITSDVQGLRERFAIPGIRVLQFGFDARFDNPHALSNISQECVLYTGTHDNNTAKGFINGKKRLWQIKNALKVLKTDRENFSWELIKMGAFSKANVFIVPIQDYLNLGSEARINIPGKKTKNWEWRMDEGMLTEELAEKIRELSLESGRIVS